MQGLPNRVTTGQWQYSPSAFGGIRTPTFLIRSYLRSGIRWCPGGSPSDQWRQRPAWLLRSSCNRSDRWNPLIPERMFSLVFSYVHIRSRTSQCSSYASRVLHLIVDDDHERRSGSDAATSAMAASNSPDATIDFAHSPMTGSRRFETNGFETTAPRRRRAARTERASSGGSSSTSTITAATVLRVSQVTGCARRGKGIR